MLDSSHSNVDVAAFDRAVELRTAERTPGLPEGPLTVVPLREDVRSFFDAHHVPQSLRVLLERHCYDHPLTIGELIFDSVNAFPGENLDEVNARCLGEGLLIVGSGLNGDPVVVDLRGELKVGFVKHEDLWDEEGPPAREVLVETGLDIGTFYLAAASSTGFPVDGYEAEDLSAEAWAAFAERTK